MESSGSGTTSSASKRISFPRPSHLGQAPAGALKEKRRGSTSSMVKPETGQAKRAEKVMRSWVSFLLRRTSLSSPRAASALAGLFPSPLRGGERGGGTPSASGSPPSLSLPRMGGGDP